MRNLFKKETWEDKFARKFYCQHARLNSVRGDKKRNTKKFRKLGKQEIKNEINSDD